MEPLERPEPLTITVSSDFTWNTIAYMMQMFSEDVALMDAAADRLGREAVIEACRREDPEIVDRLIDAMRTVRAERAHQRSES